MKPTKSSTALQNTARVPKYTMKIQIVQIQKRQQLKSMRSNRERLIAYEYLKNFYTTQEEPKMHKGQDSKA